VVSEPKPTCVELNLDHNDKYSPACPVFNFYFPNSRCAEPALIILLSSGNITSPEGVVKNLTVPSQPRQPGHELTLDPFRWDQRLISVTLRFPAVTNTATLNRYTNFATFVPQPNVIIPPCAETAEPTALMSKVTGGKAYQVHTLPELLQCMSQILSSNFVVPSVVINLEVLDPKKGAAYSFSSFP
jgi:hypothetical protein